MADAVVIGAGPNGLVAANLLADAGWDVEVLEAQAEPGGAVRTVQGEVPGFLHDRFSAFYPLAVASPVMQALELESYGLRWRHAPYPLAHPRREGLSPVLSRDLDETAASLDAFAPGDGDAWRRLYALWQRVEEPLLGALFTPFPPVRAGARLFATLGYHEFIRFLRMALLPVRRLSSEEFRGEGAGLLMAGNALHTDLGPDSAASTVFGWLLCCLGQRYGFPVPEGGAGQLVAALVRRLEERGGRVLCDQRVTQVEVRNGRAAGVRTADREVPARRAVLADVGAPQLYLDLVDRRHLPPRVLHDIARFQYDDASVRVDWSLRAPVPWVAEGAKGAATVHVAESLDELTVTFAQIARGLLPSDPFLILGQATTADPSRSPAGTESLWCYSHVPQQVRGDAAGELRGDWDTGDAERFADRMQARIEALAPGFGDLILQRTVLSPPELEAANANVVGGATNSGTAHLHQQLVFRPIPGLGRPETPIRGLYLASASAHPGGGVHGGAGANAARAALHRHRAARLLTATAAAGAAAAVTRARR